ncbi:MAG: hypothetical protein ABS79_02985 [Planctomycetes bacterium SCN 63-9]|nr:MAG: hypothetical protein ABS79_02985 [Planctomycetes bacterium SCN 63-9]
MIELSAAPAPPTPRSSREPMIPRDAARRSRFWFRLISPAISSASFVLLGSFLTLSHGQAPVVPPDAAGAANVGGGDLLRTTPFDRITLYDGSVLVVEPISPRPLPPYDKSKDRFVESKRLKSQRELLIRVGEVDQLPNDAKSGGSKDAKGEKSKAPDDDLDPNNAIAVHLLQAQGQNDIRDFKVRRALIRSVEYFEDLLVEESNRLARARQFGPAFECLLSVKSRQPDWPGLQEAANQLLFAEGSAALIDGDFERGVRLLRELLERKKDHPGLINQLADAYSQRVGRALELGLYARGRAILHQLEEIAPKHEKLLSAQDHFVSEARRRLDASKDQTGAQKLESLTEALRIWPELSEAKSEYERAFADVPTLDVGVIDVPNTLGPWVHSSADERITRLLYRPLLEADHLDAFQGKPDQQLAAKIETTDLGRRLVIHLKPEIRWSDSSRSVAAIDVARTLIDRTDPNSPRYQARWADLLDRVGTVDEHRVEVQFQRIPLHVGAWFTGPIGPAHASEDGRITTANRERIWVTNGAFRVVASSPELLDLRSNHASGEATSQGIPPRIRRIREIRIPDGPRATSALLRGDISLLSKVPATLVPGLSNQPDIKLGKYDRPSLHQIALDGRNFVLRNRNLKRGLSYAIDRKGILESRILKRASDEENYVADGPLPGGSYANAPDVPPFEYNPALAQMLLAAARKELGASPISLKLEYPDRPDVQLVVPLIVESFRVVGERSGFKIEPVPRRESELENELRSGRPFDLAYRVTSSSDAIADLEKLLSPALNVPSDKDPLGSVSSPRILQLLLELERASEFPTAKALAIQIDRESRSELPILPLWQLEEFYAWRTRLNGPKPNTDRLYQGVEGWEIRPWFARDPWMADKD